MIEITLPPSLEALCASCETICMQECCGIDAFNFSPFNVIYHLTRGAVSIRDDDVSAIRSELNGLLTKLRSARLKTDKVVISELNAILTVEQVIALFGEIDTVLSEACAIYAVHEDRIREKYQNFSRIIDAPT